VSRRERGPQEKPGTEAYGPEWRERVARGKRRATEVRRLRERVVPSDLKALARPGSPVRPDLRPLLDAAASDHLEILDALGPDPSPQRRIILEDVARLGLVLRGLVLRFGATADPEIASRIGSLAAVRRSSLQALGLDRVAREVGLREYLEQRRGQDGAGEAIDVSPVRQSRPLGDLNNGAQEACEEEERCDSEHGT